MDADHERVFSDLWIDDTDVLIYAVDLGDVDIDVDLEIDEVRAAIDAGMVIALEGGNGPRSTTSLAFLAPVIPILTDLRVATSNTVTDVDVLADAVKLRALQFIAGKCADVVDFSHLPHLEIFDGDVTRTVASVLRNPHLRSLSVYGAIPKSFARVAGPVEFFDQEGGRSQITLPEFAQPEAMTKLARRGPAQFDLTQLTQMTNLRELELTLCDDVSGLPALGQLPNLSKVRLKEVGTRESWNELPDLPWAFVLDLSPTPSDALLTKWRSAGWLIHIDPPTPPGEEVVVDDAGDGESWGLYVNRFDGLAAAVDILHRTVASGIHGEQLVLGAIAELRTQGATLNPEPDSESGLTAVYFPTHDQAEQVAALVRTILDADTDTQIRYLTAAR